MDHAHHKSWLIGCECDISANKRASFGLLSLTPSLKQIVKGNSLTSVMISHEGIAVLNIYVLVDCWKLDKLPVMQQHFSHITVVLYYVCVNLETNTLKC